MKKLLLVLFIFPVVSFCQTPYSSYYDIVNLKEKGPGFTEEIKYKISTKEVLNLRGRPYLKSKKLLKFPIIQSLIY